MVLWFLGHPVVLPSSLNILYLEPTGKNCLIDLHQDFSLFGFVAPGMYFLKCRYFEKFGNINISAHFQICLQHRIFCPRRWKCTFYLYSRMICQYEIWHNLLICQYMIGYHIYFTSSFFYPIDELCIFFLVSFLGLFRQ